MVTQAQLVTHHRSMDCPIDQHDDRTAVVNRPDQIDLSVGTQLCSSRQWFAHACSVGRCDAVTIVDTPSLNTSAVPRANLTSRFEPNERSRRPTLAVRNRWERIDPTMIPVRRGSSDSCDVADHVGVELLALAG